MSKQQWLSIIGVWVMIFLYLGFPVGWDKIFAIVTGLVIILISFKSSARHVSKNHSHTHTTAAHHQNQSAYVENNSHPVQ